MKRMWIAIVALALLSLLSISKWFIYYNAARGFLYYLGTKYNDMPNTEKAKELRDMATRQTIKEFFHR